MLENLTLVNLAMISLLWTIPLKGITLWLSAKRDQKIWFIFLLVFHTMGIVELIYLLIYGAYFNQKSPVKREKPKSKPRPKRKK